LTYVKNFVILWIRVVWSDSRWCSCDLLARTRRTNESLLLRL